MSCLLHVSDPHFGTERPEVVAALRALAAALAPEIVVLSGDITQRARRAQFRAARAFVDSLAPARLLVIPGNHDIPLFDLYTRLVNPYREHRRAFGRDLEPELATDHWLVLGVNTTRPHRHKDGEVSTAQIERVATRLQRAGARQLRVVVVHQPIGVMRAQDEPDRLHGAERAVHRWAGAGADLILGGHIHLPYVLPLHDAMPGVPRRLWAVQAGTAVSHRVRAEADNSVNVLRHAVSTAARRVEIERWDWRPATQRFERAHVEGLDLAPNG
jgi:3',5'-cyclic AMP phosphodiesterase CpdA